MSQQVRPRMGSGATSPLRSNRIRLAALAALAAGGVSIAGPAFADITRFDVTTRESPTFGGYSWPGVGQYEKLAGTAYAELDPNDPKNAKIVDLALAPRNANGMVEYSFDFYILKPIDLSKGAHKVMYEPPNRGNKTWNTFGRITGGNDPGTITDPTVLAGAFLMPRGYTMVWSGWDQAAGTDNTGFKTTIALPVAHNADGSSITGPGYEYIVESTGTPSYTLNYPAATLDQTQATLTHRIHLDDTPEVMPASSWSYDATGKIISIVGGNFVANDIYEFTYVNKDPTVNATGFAAVRDFNAWLRFESADQSGNANPLAGDIQRIYTETVSQPARMLNDFVHLGFNQAETGQKVFDGMMQWIGAGDGINMNYRFSQPGRTERNRQDELYAEGVFPMANVSTHDKISKQTDSRFASCEATNTCPLTAEIYSANEYWVKAASLLHTTPDGKKDLPDSPYARNYFISSHQHGVGNGLSAGVCQQLQNPLDSAPIQRALWVAIDDWTNGVAPPPSDVPRLSDGTMTSPSQIGFPSIPGVTFTGLKTTRYRYDYGQGYYSTGIASIYPPTHSDPFEDNPANGPIYPSYVPIVDRDGNDIPGVHLPDVEVPLATYTGWALRAGEWGNDGCEGSGQYIPFKATKAERVAAGDPRKSVKERYPSNLVYRFRVLDSLEHLVDRRLMLCEDTQAQVSRLFAAGLAAGVPAPIKGLKGPDKVPACYVK